MAKLDLGKIVANAFNTIDKSIKGAVKKVTYNNRPGQPTYDPVSGFTDNTVEYTLKGILMNYEIGDVDGNNVQFGDQKFLVPGNSVSFTPTPEDTVTIEGEGNWNVVRAEKDPTYGALYTFTLRR